MNKFILIIIITLWNILHISFFKLNEIMKIADSFAYLQMAHYFNNFSILWFWNGWFWFIYSFFISIFNIFNTNDMISSFILNIFLFNILIYLSYKFTIKYLKKTYIYLFITLLYLSPILLHYNIHILSENIYIPLFILLFLQILNFKNNINFKNSIFLWILVALLYLTRAEAFIYIWSILFIFWYLYYKKSINTKIFISNGLVFIASFFIFILPYLFYMNSFTWEWWLTNKWSANLRQAELRWISKMDDDWFEQAVWELRPDNHWLIAGFAGWLKYDKPVKWDTFKSYILKNPTKVLSRIFDNQIKLYTQNIPRLISWNAKDLFWVQWSILFYKNYLFLFFVLIPVYLFIFWIYNFIKTKEYYFLVSFLLFFSIASLFFTLFFVLDRYFVIFVPLFIFFIVYWAQSISFENIKYENIKYYLISFTLISIYSLWLLSYYNTFKTEDDKYFVKKIAWERLKDNYDHKIKVMERFPVVTYYSNTKERWLTPYTDKIENLVEYAKFNKINFLVVDSVDFKNYRPWLEYLLTEPKDYNWLKYLKKFYKNGQTVILYEIKN